MRADIVAIARLAAGVATLIQAREPGPARDRAAKLLDILPPDDVFDPEPGVTVCSMPEYNFAKLLPYLRGTARKWHAWLEAPSEPWPDPERLMACRRGLESIMAEMGIPAGAATAETETANA